MGIINNIKRWVMNMFNISQKIVPESALCKGYYDEYISKWKTLYKCESRESEFKNVNGNTRKRKMKSIRASKLICSELASLLYSEKVDVSIKDNNAYTEYVRKVLKENNYQSQKLELLEYMFALGGSVEKVYRRDEKTIINYIVADSFIPTQWDNNSISGGLFVTQSKKSGFIYSLIERHEYSNKTITIETKLFKSSKDSPDMEGIEVSLATLYPDLLPVVVIENINKPLFSYSKPAIANNIDFDTPLGISILENCSETLEILDTCFDSWEREFKLGKKRIMVPSYMVKSHVFADGTTSNYFNPNDDNFQAYNGDENDGKITDDTQVLRVDEHIATINALLNVVCIQVGLSVGAISFDAKGGLKTATEVVSDNSKTYRTKKRHEINIEKGMKELIHSIIDIGILYKELKKQDYEIEVKFDDSIIIDSEAEAVKDMQKVTMGLMSKERYLVKHEGYTIEEANEELAKISGTVGDDE